MFKGTRTPASPQKKNPALKDDSHTSCRATAILWQYSVLRESLRGSRKYPNC
jgi:hypothetical protein